MQPDLASLFRAQPDYYQQCALNSLPLAPAYFKSFNPLRLPNFISISPRICCAFFLIPVLPHAAALTRPILLITHIIVASDSLYSNLCKHLIHTRFSSS